MSNEDVFDFIGRKVGVAIIETAKALEGMSPEFKAGGYRALEELWIRMTGCDLDIEDVLFEDALFAAWKASHTGGSKP